MDTVIVEDVKTGQTRTVDLTPTWMKLPRTPKAVIRPEQSSVMMEPMRKNRNIFYVKDYTTDGCNKVEKVMLGRVMGKTRSELPHACWKATAKRSRRAHQWKRKYRGGVSARILNLMGRCIYPNIWFERRWY